MICHGENFLSSQPAREEVWNARIDRMVGKENLNRPAQSYAEGVLSYRAQWARNWSKKDREVLVAYLVKNFGPGARPRNVKTVKETPLDETKLAKAMYMEYYVPADAPGQGIHDPQYADALGFSGRRVIQDVRFDAEGNVVRVEAQITEQDTFSANGNTIVGRMASALGTQFVTVAVGWELYERTHSALALGLVGLAARARRVRGRLPALRQRAC